MDVMFYRFRTHVFFFHFFSCILVGTCAAGDDSAQCKDVTVPYLSLRCQILL